jgi:PHD/YefM family antitoxin component YafN of YafNO toxin-antitoxin module
MSQFTAREFNQDVSRVKRASKDGPAFISERGKPSHVLMTIEAYNKLATDKTRVPLIAFLEGLALAELDITRDPDTGRDVIL